MLIIREKKNKLIIREVPVMHYILFPLSLVGVYIYLQPSPPWWSYISPLVTIISLNGKSHIHIELDGSRRQCTVISTSRGITNPPSQGETYRFPFSEILKVIDQPEATFVLKEQAPVSLNLPKVSKRKAADIIRQINLFIERTA
ncbi:MAG: hypothetical protein CL920_25970 [Deltaproteobacteria bacterium]|nr:hypothetical protein [Deltaproteobacteria bacterium]|tara:strand:+ start:5291 stop:5722 length:432 start_codon:yes stop_codon:yes gene_type:complete